MKEKLYEEVGTSYRFFLNWRHAMFAGNLVVLGGALSLCVSAYKDAREIAWLIPLCASPVGFLLWMIDVRNRQHYHAAIKAGKALESHHVGFYSLLAKEIQLQSNRSPFRKITHSAALNVAFLGSPLILLATSFLLWRMPAKSKAVPGEQPTPVTAPASPAPVANCR